MTDSCNQTLRSAMRILVVDDLPELRRAVRRTLRSLGYQVTEAEGGREALALLVMRPFDVVLSDVMMPEVNGMALLSAAVDHDPSLPVILMSACPTSGTAKQAVAQGAFAYLTKPLDTRTLHVAITRALDSRRGPVGTARRTPSAHKIHVER